jgi:hypothetical protein
LARFADAELRAVLTLLAVLSFKPVRAKDNSPAF